MQTRKKPVVLAVIPARSGSKSLKDKNIREIMDKPMLAYSIEHAKQSKMIDRVIISTDSKEYAEIASSYGCEVPFLRPPKYARDNSLDLDVFKHALKFLRDNENYIPDIVVQLRPTYPIRDIAAIDDMIKLLIENSEADSVRCIAPAKEIAYKMWREQNGELIPILNDIKEAYNMPRQQLPQIYYQNACIDVFRSSVVLNQNSMSGKKILGYKMKHNFDIDTEEDFLRAERFLMMKKCTGKTFVFDIDGVIAEFNETLQYDKSMPNVEIIHIVNSLYDRGNKIILFTARGYSSGIDWRNVTQEQLSKWDVKYHELKFGKPAADYYIDDKMLGVDELIYLSQLYGEV